MPRASLRQCTYPGCRNIGDGPRCPAHPYERKKDTRPSAGARGYDADWRALRRWKLRRDPTCQIRVKCSSGPPPPAVEVDHKVPISHGGARLDPDNLQSACKACHSWKTGHVDKRRRRVSR